MQRQRSFLLLWLLRLLSLLPFQFSGVVLFLILNTPADVFVHLGNEGLLLHVDTMGKVGDIGRTQYLVGDHRDALHYAADGLTTLHGVANILNRQPTLEGDKVRLVLLDIAFQVIGRVLTGKRVGVVAIGQQQHFDIHALSQQHVGASHGSVDTSLITIV